MEAALLRLAWTARLAVPVLLAISTGLGAVAAEPGADPVSDLVGAPGVVRHDLTGEELLASMPTALVTRLRDNRVVMMQEVREAGALSGGLILGLVIFEQPIDTVYRYLSQTARQIEYRPEVTSIETTARNAEGPVDSYRIRVLFRNYVYTLQYSMDPAKREIRWSLAPGVDNDLRQVNGSWELYALGADRTLGRFGTSVDVGPAVPGFLQDWITRKNVPESMQRARRWVDSEGRYRP